MAKYEDAIWATWHFVSPDGTQDLDYAQAAKEFPTMEIRDGYASTMELIGIPYALNGWSVYCDFSNNTGHTQTTNAKISVNQAVPGTAQQTAPQAAPQTTPQATPEPIIPGE